MKRLKKICLCAYLAVACLLIGFSYLSFITDDWQWLARSGCLIVITGMLMTSQEILSNIKRLKKRYKRNSSPTRHDWAKGSASNNVIAAIAHEESTWEVAGHGFYMLLFGTLVWGFGDIVGMHLIA